VAQAELREHQREAEHERGAERQHYGIIEQGMHSGRARRMKTSFGRTCRMTGSRGM
jgi:hypothetical protein